MLRRLLLLTLPGMLLVQCAPAVPAVEEPAASVVQTGQTQLVESRRELQEAIASWATMAQNPVHFRLSPQLYAQWESVISEAAWGEYARRCSARIAETGHVSLTLEYRDYVRLCAALRRPEVRASLSSSEQRVLRQLETLVARSIRPGMSSFDKLVALHDELVQMARYDADAGGNIADILEKGCGSCEAYSSTLCVMLELAGIPARVVTGSADGPHAWNLVKIGHEWYHVDATWDDPIIATSRRQVVSHTYCCVSDAEMAVTHRWNCDSYPASGKRAAYYYRQRGIYFTSVSAYWQAAMVAYRRGAENYEGYLTCYGSPAAFQKEVQKLMQADGPEHINWTGPETAAGPVILSFNAD